MGNCKLQEWQTAVSTRHGIRTEKELYENRLQFKQESRSEARSLVQVLAECGRRGGREAIRKNVLLMSLALVASQGKGQK